VIETGKNMPWKFGYSGRAVSGCFNGDAARPADIFGWRSMAASPRQSSDRLVKSLHS
jgi:hypothetical protein